MDYVYAFIFRNGRHWWGKLSASTIIGGVALGSAAYGSGNEWAAAEIGATLGFMAALVLIARDICNGVEIDGETGEPVRIPPWWGGALMAVSALGVITAIVAGVLVFGDLK